MYSTQQTHSTHTETGSHSAEQYSWPVPYCGISTVGCASARVHVLASRTITSLLYFAGKRICTFQGSGLAMPQQAEHLTVAVFAGKGWGAAWRPGQRQRR